MAYIDNSDTKRELNDAIRGNAVSNIAPTKLGDTIIPVIDVNPKLLRRINIVKRAGSAATVYTTPTDKDFYLVAICSAISSTAAGNNGMTVNATIKGDSASTILQRILTQNSATVDCASSNNTITLPMPVPLERNSTITTTTTGALTNSSCTIYGYTVEP